MSRRTIQLDNRIILFSPDDPVPPVNRMQAVMKVRVTDELTGTAPDGRIGLEVKERGFLQIIQGRKVTAEAFGDASADVPQANRQNIAKVNLMGPRLHSDGHHSSECRKMHPRGPVELKRSAHEANLYRI